ncbi:AzlC family ABC transporter permease [Polynucleobacter kasalickyi]|uniref:Predicted branched-chain amino acid permease (Azaleucine resistance) n=1 Tax=Polynucleobacter kasalickyi TaxID=1938817 RepID=A0A1W2A1E2_9BURK|nr:AzlC family ABC transporter permease [Polynucleobacter kasalickyi]SMC54507.1 Predicted branched-chain amino acid permease (azaleucine resistance) [Polynucleobacter kasalickyi]
MKIFKTAEIQQGINDMLGPSLGIFTWSIVLNLAIIKTGFAIFHTIVMSFTVYAGSAQLASIPLINGHFPIWIILLTTIVINSRFIVYSAAIAPHFQHLSFPHRCLIGFLNGDISFAVFSKKYPTADTNDSKKSIYQYFLGSAMMNWLVWQLGLGVALFFGMQIPDEWNFAFAGTLVLICLITPNIKTPKEITIGLVSVLVAILTINLPYRLGILSTVLAAMCSGFLIEQLQRKNA